MHHLILRRSGLSPRVRGNRDAARGRKPADRSIPAGAGEPLSTVSVPPGHTVYPRGCGGTSFSPPLRRPGGGLSPRVRGNQVLEEVGSGVEGSIPAGAGEPRSGRGLRRCWKVYPRGCGGTVRGSTPSLGRHGLSPRVRGNRVGPPLPLRRGGSIPAGAGEPMRPRRRNWLTTVYPRGCGGTQKRPGAKALLEGLSPRVRGNRPRVHAVTWPPRSIPAGAGEPRRPAVAPPTGWVYPRGCGGTDAPTPAELVDYGLSPRVRGNLRMYSCGCAPWRVYPRGCGGTASSAAVAVGCAGLSPRVRGNLGGGLGHSIRPGSIPAGAGEPE